MLIDVFCVWGLEIGDSVDYRIWYVWCEFVEGIVIIDVIWFEVFFYW